MIWATIFCDLASRQYDDDGGGGADAEPGREDLLAP